MPRFVIGHDDQSLPTDVRLAVGDDLEVAVEENATTGFEWDAKAEPGDVLSVVRSEFDAPGTAAPGAGGLRRFVLTAKRAGDATVTLELRRPWETGRPARRRVVVPVAVRA